MTEDKKVELYKEYILLRQDYSDMPHDKVIESLTRFEKSTGGEIGGREITLNTIVKLPLSRKKDKLIFWAKKNIRGVLRLVKLEMLTKEAEEYVLLNITNLLTGVASEWHRGAEIREILKIYAKENSGT